MTSRSAFAVLLVICLLTAAIPFGIPSMAAAQPAGPVAYWAFDEGAGTTAGTTAGDSAGDNDGTISGATWTSDAISGTALDFDGIDDYVDIGTDPSLLHGHTAIAIEAWIKPDASGEYRCIFISNRTAGGETIALVLTPSNLLHFWVQPDSTNNSRCVDTDTSLTLGTWYHVVAMWDGTNDLKIYVNGTSATVTQAYSAGNISGMLANPTPIADQLIGQYAQGYPPFGGTLDEVRIYDRALSAQEILDHYNAENPATAPSGPVAHWTFDEGTGTTANDSIGTANGIITGATWTGNAISGTALSFDGNDRVALTETTALQPSTHISMEAWFYPTNLTTACAIMSLETMTGANKGAMLILSGSTLRLFVGNGSASVYTDYVISEANRWYHVVGTYDGSQTVIWVDGQLRATNPLTGSIAYESSRGMNIGYWEAGGPAYFRGAIDEVRLYDYVLPEDAIVDHYDAEAPTSGPVAHWTFDEGTGTTAADSAGSNDGTITGAAWTTDAISGTALSFDGVGDYVQIANEEPFDFGSGPYTISCWAKTAGGRSCNEHILSKGDVWGGNDDYVLWVSQSDGHLEFEYRYYGSNDLASTARVDDNAWHHIVVTQSGACAGCAKLYVDGAIETTEAGETLTNGTDPLILGATYSGGALYSFDGTIDEVRIYNRALSAQEILDQYNAEKPLSGPVAHWTFDEGTGTTAADSVGSNQGTLMNGAAWVESPISGNAIEIDGIDDYVDTGLQMPAGATPIKDSVFTVSAWFNADSTAGSLPIIGRGDGTTETCGDWSLAIVNNALRLQMRTSTELSGNTIGTEWAIAEFPVSPNTWYHAVGMWDNSAILYINGAPVATATSTTNDPNEEIDPVRIGRQGNNSDYFDGTLDEVRIYDRALSAQEILDQYNAEKPATVQTYTLTTASTSGGSVTTPGEGTYSNIEGTVVDLVATADAGYEFLNWTGDVADAGSVVTTVTMDSDKSVSANFQATGSITTVFYPDADPETSSVDGFTVNGAWQSWASAHDSASGTSVDSDTALHAGPFRNASGQYVIYRSMALFDTSTLPDGCTVTSATLSLYGWNESDELTGSTATFNVYSADPTSSTGLTAQDYASSRYGTTAYVDSDITISSWDSSGWNDLSLNSQGIENISKTGITSFGLRNKNFDVDNSAPAGGEGGSAISAYSAEQGQSYAPKLAVTYTIEAPSGPVAHWAFDETAGTTAYDSAGDHNGTVMNDATWVSDGISGNALSFDGTDDYVQIDDHVDWNLVGSTTDDRAISLWVRHTDHAGYGEYYLTQWESGGDFWNMVHYDSLGLFFSAEKNVSPLVNTSYTAEITDSGWHHLVVNKVGNTFTLYKDTDYVDSDVMTSWDTYAGDLFIGQRGNSSGYFHGTMDEVRFYDRSLSSKEIQDLFGEYQVTHTVTFTSTGNGTLSGETTQSVTNGGDCSAVTATPDTGYIFESWTGDYTGTDNPLTITNVSSDMTIQANFVEPIASGLVAHWAFDETTGTTASDSTGNHDGTVMNDATWVSDGISGYALKFDGTNDYVRVSDDNDWNLVGSDTDDRAISLWVRHTDHAGYGEYYLTQWESGGDFWNLVHYDGLGLFFSAESNVSPLVNTSYTGEITDSGWHHLVINKVGDTFTVYKDTVYVDSAVMTSSDTYGGDLFIGQRGNSSGYFYGTMDEVRFYDRSLSSQEIQDLFDQHVETGPIAHWTFDEGTGTLAGDSAGTNDGAVAGAAWTTDAISGGALEFNRSPGRFPAACRARVV